MGVGEGVGGTVGEEGAEVGGRRWGEDESEARPSDEGG